VTKQRFDFSSYKKLRFGLLQVFCLIAFIATCLAIWTAWRANNVEIVGKWHSSNSAGVLPIGYRETLELYSTGQFEKIEMYDRFVNKFTGDFSMTADGVFEFDVLSYETSFEQGKAESVEFRIQCRCAIDTSGNLLISKLDEFGKRNFRVYDDDSFFRSWYTKLDSKQQKQQILSKIQRVFGEADGND
jgi:hypothetical protein